MIVCMPSIAAVTGLRMYHSGGYGFCSGRRYMGSCSKLWKRPAYVSSSWLSPSRMIASVSQIARVVGLGVGLLAPEEGLHHAAAAHADLQPPVAQVVEHADLFDQPQRVVQRQHVDARAEAQAPRALGHAAQEHVLRRGQAVDRRRVVLGQVIGVEAGRVEALDLHQALAVDLVEAAARAPARCGRRRRIAASYALHEDGGPRHGPPYPPTLVTPRRSRAAPRDYATDHNKRCGPGRRARRRLVVCWAANPMI